MYSIRPSRREGTVVDDNDSTKVNHDEQSTSTIEGAGDEDQGGEAVGAGSGSAQRGRGGARSSIRGEQLGAGARNRAVSTEEKLVEAVLLLSKALHQNPQQQQHSQHQHQQQRQ